MKQFQNVTTTRQHETIIQYVRNLIKNTRHIFIYARHAFRLQKTHQCYPSQKVNRLNKKKTIRNCNAGNMNQFQYVTTTWATQINFSIYLNEICLRFNDFQLQSISSFSPINARSFQSKNNIGYIVCLAISTYN